MGTGHRGGRLFRPVNAATARQRLKQGKNVSRHPVRQHVTPASGASDRSRRLRWIGRAKVLAILLTVIALSAMDHAGWLLANRPDGDQYHLMATRVMRVIDGDTIEVQIPDPIKDTQTTRVRLIGIDCPEIAHPAFSSKPAEPFAEEAAALARSLVDGQRVVLRVEPQQTRDVYDRLLAHVDLENGTNLAEQLLMAGLACREDRWNHSMLLRYRQLELTARRARRGMWQ